VCGVNECYQVAVLVYPAAAWAHGERLEARPSPGQQAQLEHAPPPLTTKGIHNT